MGTDNLHGQQTKTAEAPEYRSLLALAATLLHSDTPRALELADGAQALATAAGDSAALAEACRILGVGHAVTGRYEQAGEFFRRGHELHTANGNHRGAAVMLTNLGNVCNFLGDYSSALAWYGRSRDLCARHGIDSHLPSVYLNMGYSHRGMSNYQEALACLQQGLAVCDTAGTTQTKAGILHNIGTIHADRGDYTEALRYFADSLAASTELTYRHGMAAVYNDIGTVHFRLGNYGRALRSFTRSLGICEQMGDNRGAALALNNIGDLYAQYGRHDRALQYFQASLRIKEELGNRSDIAGTLLNVGRMHSALGALPEALDYCTRCIGMAEEAGNTVLLADGLQTAADLHMRTGSTAEARTLLSRALDLYTTADRPEGRIRTQIALGSLHLTTSAIDDATAILQQALSEAERIAARPLVMQAHEALARTFKHTGNTEQALRHYELFHRQERELFTAESDNRMQRLLLVFDIEREQHTRQLAEKQADILRIENSRMLQEMEFRAKELVTTAMYLTQKNEFLRSLHRTLRDLADEAPAALRAKLQSLQHEIGQAVDSEQSWSHFERQFRQVHEEYIDRLAEQFPAVTPTERKVCALIRLDLSTKEIANILNTEPRSIEKYRQRIRKKLGLAPADNLNSFLHSLR